MVISSARSVAVAIAGARGTPLSGSVRRRRAGCWAYRAKSGGWGRSARMSAGAPGRSSPPPQDRHAAPADFMPPPGDFLLVAGDVVRTTGDVVRPPGDETVPVRKAIAQTEPRVDFLPRYSPELNPIEMAWSNLNESLRWAKPRRHGQPVRRDQGRDGGDHSVGRKGLSWSQCLPGCIRRVTAVRLNQPDVP